MNQTGLIEEYKVYQLTYEVLLLHIETITSLVNLIPKVKYTKSDILADSKLDRKFTGKWEHSLVVFDKNKPIAIIIGYERKREDNAQYPENSIYISELVVAKNYQQQGIAKNILKKFLTSNKSFIHLSRNVVFSVQTNSAKWNQRVIDLYKSTGFKTVSEKKYSNRKDVILNLQLKN